MSSDESDDDLLANLLANADNDSSKANVTNTPPKQTKTNVLKELDFNFLDDDFASNFEEEFDQSKPSKNSVSVLDNNDNSSDEEDKKYFEEQRYSDYGRDIKQLLKNKEEEKSSFKINFQTENLNNTLKNTPNVLVSKTNSSLENNLNSLIQRSDKNNLQVPTNSNLIQKDIYSDPIFGFRIVKPLISSAELIEKMQDKKAVTVSTIKLHLANSSVKNCSENWVIAGVIINKSGTKTSQKGNQYCIWQISDLSMDMKTISVFLFNSAYKSFWKLTTGVVIGILNPSVLENRDDKELATLSVDIAQKVLILGNSKDLGKCKSIKKNGTPCTAPVNLRKCEYCIYHVKQEYSKYSRRPELQTLGPKRSFDGPNTFKKSGIMQQRHPEALPFIAIPAKRNEALFKKDCERLALLRGEKTAVDKNKLQLTTPPNKKIKSTTIEISSAESKKDFKRLDKLHAFNAHKSENEVDFKLKLSSPKLASGMKDGFIDFSEPISTHNINKAKHNAIQWVKANGGFKKINPNKIRPDKEVMSVRGAKRKRDLESEVEENIKKDVIKTKFQELLEIKSSHTDLINRHEDEETEKYFNKLEVKERMEEKMLTTYQISCKAVYCSVCKYVAFSSSDLCKTLHHPTKVIDAVKKFFKCGDCGNRTVSLDRIPSETCKRCCSSKWIKAPMMDEKRTEVSRSKLCIRGGEEKFIGSNITDKSLNLLVPESD